MEYLRRVRTPGAKWKIIPKKDLYKKLEGYYKNIDLVIEAMDASPGKPIVTTGHADYMAEEKTGIV